MIWPPVTTYPPDPSIPNPSLPLGLAYIAAYLEREGYDARILDALALGHRNVTKVNGGNRVGLSVADIEKAVENFSPDIVGISCMFSGYARDSHDCAQIVKKVSPNSPIVFGGAHSSGNPHMVLRDENVDVVVKGEGELTFLELVKAYENKESIRKIPGTVVRSEDGIFFNEKRPYIKDLDSLPFPALHLLPMDIYMRAGEKHPYVMRRRGISMISSRGCPMKCVYCSIHSVWGNTWRGRSPQNVVDEIEHLIDKYHVREIAFRDDNLTLDRKRTVGICEEIIRRKLDIKWCTPAGVAVWTLNNELVKKMKDSGCYRLTFGIESGNKETLRFIGKPLAMLDRAKSIIQYANKIGLWTICTFIIGFPHEKIESINDTINYAINCGTDYAVFYILAPFPGTPVIEIFQREGLITGAEEPQLWAYMLSGGGVNTKYFTKEELAKLQQSAQTKFLKRRFISFMNPLRLARKIHSYEDLKYTLRLIRSGVRMRKALSTEPGESYSLERVLWQKEDRQANN